MHKSVPDDLGTTPVEEVNCWLTRFILQVMTGGGKLHTRRTPGMHFHEYALFSP